MIRIFIVVGFWLLTLGIFSIKISWTDGLFIELTGWPDAIKTMVQNSRK